MIVSTQIFPATHRFTRFTRSRRLSIRNTSSRAVFHDPDKFLQRRNQFTFTPVETSVGVDPKLLQTLLGYLTFEDFPPPIDADHTPQGRSVLLDVPGAPMRLKAKGAFGLVQHAEGKMELVPPTPQKRLALLPEWHVKISKDFSIEPVEGSARARNSLTLQGGKQEFHCRRRLAALGLALPPIFYGQYLLRDTTTPEHDFLGREVGAECHFHPASLRPFDAIFPWIVIPGTDRYTLFDSITAAESPITTKSLSNGVAQIARFAAIMGSLRRRAILEGGVLRHAGHLGNFLLDTATDKGYLADFDSCIVADDMEPNLRAPYLLRDIGSDLVHLYKVALKTLLCKPLPGVLRSTQEPIRSYLEGFFGRDLPTTRKYEISRSFSDSVVRLIGNAKLDLQRQRDLYIQASFLEDDETYCDLFKASFYTAVQNLWAPALQIAFRAASDTKVIPARGYGPVGISSQQFDRQVVQGITRYLLRQHEWLQTATRHVIANPAEPLDPNG